jgi:hypothetical protein
LLCDGVAKQEASLQSKCADRRIESANPHAWGIIISRHPPAYDAAEHLKKEGLTPKMIEHADTNGDL